MSLRAATRLVKPAARTAGRFWPAVSGVADGRADSGGRAVSQSPLRERNAGQLGLRVSDVVREYVENACGNPDRVEFRVKQKLCERVVSATMTVNELRSWQRDAVGCRRFPTGVGHVGRRLLLVLSVS